jgi:hypothetical protein
MFALEQDTLAGKCLRMEQEMRSKKETGAYIPAKVASIAANQGCDVAMGWFMGYWYSTGSRSTMTFDRIKQLAAILGWDNEGAWK